jgi:hypothetical protein
MGSESFRPHRDASTVIFKPLRIGVILSASGIPQVLTRPFLEKKLYRLAEFDQIMEAMCTNTDTAALMEAAATQNYGKK